MSNDLNRAKCRTINLFYWSSLELYNFIYQFLKSVRQSELWI